MSFGEGLKRCFFRNLDSNVLKLNGALGGRGEGCGWVCGLGWV